MRVSSLYIPGIYNDETRIDRQGVDQTCGMTKAISAGLVRAQIIPLKLGYSVAQNLIGARRRISDLPVFPSNWQSPQIRRTTEIPGRATRKVIDTSRNIPYRHRQTTNHVTFFHTENKSRVTGVKRPMPPVSGQFWSQLVLGQF